MVLMMGSAATAEAASPKAAVQAWRRAHEKEIVSDFVALLSMPNVATTVPDVERNAAYISGLLQKRGFKTRLLTAEPGTPPSILAELATPESPSHDGRLYPLRRPADQPEGLDLHALRALHAHRPARSQTR